MLTDLKDKSVLVSGQGERYVAHKVRKPVRDTGYDEPLYRLERLGLKGNKEWTLEELRMAGLQEVE